MTPIPASVNYSVIELLSKNQNYEYEFSYQNYDIYWSIFALLPNGTDIELPSLKNYFTYNITYMDENYRLEELSSEPCKIDHQDVFLGLDEQTVKNDNGKIAIYRICIKDKFKMGIFPNTNISQVLQPEFYFSLYQCVNTTTNNNSCCPQEEIDEMIKYTTVQTTIPTTIYDFKNYKKPQKNNYDYHYTKLDKSMLKYYQNSLITSTLFLDDGLLSDHYRTVSVNFNPNIDYDPNLRKENDPLFVFDCMISYNFQMYYLRNQKLNEIVGNLGGLINAIFLLGKLLCISYNSMYLRFKIINTTFSFSPSNAPQNNNSETFTKVKSDSIRKGLKMARKFSYCSYLFPSKQIRYFYQMGSKHLHEYLDIRKIIKRLQDLDKLKMVLLTEDQRRLFEHIPKPYVIDPTNKFSMESITKYKKKAKTRKATIVITNLEIKGF